MILQGRLLIDPDTAPVPGWLRVEDGRIAELGEGDAPGDAGPTLGGVDRIISPGFVDAHLHLPQVRGIGCAEPTLLEWLERVIFPLESSWADPAVVDADLRIAHGRMIAAGTTGCAAFSSPHAGAMPQVMSRAGLPAIRMVVGQALMDRGAPDGLVHDPPWEPVASLDGPRIAASINPRFALSCGDGLLARAAGLVAPPTSGPSPTSPRIVHTHLAESIAECARVRDLFPHDPSYTAVYDRHGLLGSRTLLAHALHLSRPEWETIATRRCVLVRCPQANAFLGSGMFDAKAARDHGIRLALGSDIAAGSDFAMPRVARSMIECDKLRASAVDRATPVATPEEAWRMVTRGNAEALGWDDGGRLEVGASADLLVLRPGFEIDRHLVGRLIHDWSDRWIEHVVMAGRRIR